MKVPFPQPRLHFNGVSGRSGDINATQELNLMKDQKLSLVELLHVCFKETKETEMSSLEKVLLIFDGLDKCRFPLDSQNTVKVSDVTESASVQVLLINLIKGNLLPSALIWITSRPAAADQIPSECVHRVTEVQGFNDPQKEKYFRKSISDQSLANNIITHLKSLRSLYIMCHIPVFCWISATVLERMLSEAESGEIPKTLTQMYTHFVIIQTNIIREKYPEKKDSNNKILLKLGQLAFQQLSKGNLIFYEEDLRQCGIDVREAAVYSVVSSGVCVTDISTGAGRIAGSSLKREPAVSPPVPASSKPLLKAHITVNSQNHDLAVFLDSGADSEFMDQGFAHIQQTPSWPQYHTTCLS
ncbi:hypothetical protein QTP70_012955 [Hemibagrus guttatus]|uniref:NLRC3 n=1 Tax=Hemibagrus guttatus TaxID=175788 RepID=A0AAE0UTX2_9TELE|nr:hypothetical protein QTP70_012955 [Hemibagrus guttatus]